MCFDSLLFDLLICSMPFQGQLVAIILSDCLLAAIIYTVPVLTV